MLLQCHGSRQHYNFHRCHSGVCLLLGDLHGKGRHDGGGSTNGECRERETLLHTEVGSGQELQFAIQRCGPLVAQRQAKAQPTKPAEARNEDQLQNTLLQKKHPSPCKSTTKVPKFDGNNTYCCPDKGVVCTHRGKTQAVTIAS